ncbi:hypothetical protein BDW72DRAFT_212594 [Aspergillus terricola var. indicus]
MAVQVAFIIPLGNSDHHCHDAITPNDWLSDTACAFTGSLIHYGVWVLVIGCFFRSLSLYLQLIWDIEPGKRFRSVALLSIFGGSLGLLGISLGVSGVSYQVGDMCYISYPDSIGSFWGPLIGVAFISWVIQMFIMVYSVRGVLTRGGTARFSIFKKRSDDSDPLSRAAQARAMRRNIWQILELQWRAIAICCLILIYVVYVAQEVLRWGDPGQYSAKELKPWIECLVREAGNRHACLDEASAIGPNQKSVVAALAMLASCGVLGIVCTARYTMILGWIDWFHGQFDALADLLPGRDHTNSSSTVTLTPGAGAGSDCRRGNGLDLELASASSNDTHSDGVTAVDSPTTLEEVDKLYGSRIYHVPKNSFSRPGTVHSLLSRSDSNSTWNDPATPGHVYPQSHPISKPPRTSPSASMFSRSSRAGSPSYPPAAASVYVGGPTAQNSITTRIETANCPAYSLRERE